MLKTLQIPFRGLLAVAFLLTAAPASQAVIDTNLYDSLLKKCYNHSENGDATDIRRFIQTALEEHPDQGLDLVEKLIKKLKANKDKLDSDVTNADLDRVLKKLRRWLSSHRTQGTGGNINTPESATTHP